MDNSFLSKHPLALDFLLDISIYDQLDEIAAKNNLPPERTGEFLDLTDAVMNGQMSIEKMPEFIAQAFGVEGEVAKNIAADLAGYRLLPLEDFIPGVAPAIRAWGGDVKAYPLLRIRKPERTPEVMLREYAQSIGLNLPEHIMKRFIFLAKGYLTHERSREATITLMTRPLNIGGLELTELQTEKVLKKIDGVDLTPPPPPPKTQALSLPPLNLPIESCTTGTNSKQPLQDVPKKKDALAVIATGRALTKEVPVIAGSLIDTAQAQEIERHLKRTRQIIHAIPKRETEDSKAEVELIYPFFKRARVSKTDTQTFVSRFLAGRYDSTLSLSLLIDKYHLHVDDANAVLDALEIAKVNQDRALRATLNNHSQDKIPVEPDTTEEEGRLMAQKHAAITKNVSSEPTLAIMPGARVSAARTKSAELSAQRARIDEEGLKQAQKTQKPLPAKVELSAKSAPPATRAAAGGVPARLPVADVSFTRQLIGPVEELGTMTSADFRRLGSDPGEATRKIENALALLEETLYEKRLEGVQAWRQSPVNQLYVAMAGESLLKGLTVAEVAAGRRNRGEESLSPAEIQVIIALNGRIGF